MRWPVWKNCHSYRFVRSYARRCRLSSRPAFGYGSSSIVAGVREPRVGAGAHPTRRARVMSRKRVECYFARRFKPLAARPFSGRSLSASRKLATAFAVSARCSNASPSPFQARGSAG